MENKKLQTKKRCFFVFFYSIHCVFSPTFVLQPESSCRHTNIGEEVEVELVGGAVEESGDGGALGTGLKAEFRNVTLNMSPIKASLHCFQTAKSLPSLGLLIETKYKLQVASHACR